MKVLEVCPFCGGLLAGHWVEPAFSKCQSCRLVIANPFPEPEELNSLYKDSWEDPSANTWETGGTRPDLAVQYVSQLFDQLDVDPGTPGLRILDFGAGRGTLMAELEARGGLDVYGVDPYGADELARVGLRAYRDLKDLHPDLRFDGIISMDVIEHLPAPWETLRDLKGKLKPGGWLYISTPNPDGLNARLNGQRWREAQKPGHILFLGTATLSKMFDHAGYQRSRRLIWKVQMGDSRLRDSMRMRLEAVGLGGATRIAAWR